MRGEADDRRQRRTIRGIYAHDRQRVIDGPFLDDAVTAEAGGGADCRADARGRKAPPRCVYRSGQVVGEHVGVTAERRHVGKTADRRSA